MKKTLKEIFETYQIYNNKGQLLPLLETELGKELFGEVNELNKSDVSGRSELLIDFMEYVQKNQAIYFIDKIKLAKEYLKSINSR